MAQLAFARALPWRRGVVSRAVCQPRMLRGDPRDHRAVDEEFRDGCYSTEPPLNQLQRRIDRLRGPAADAQPRQARLDLRQAARAAGKQVDATVGYQVAEWASLTGWKGLLREDGRASPAGYLGFFGISVGLPVLLVLLVAYSAQHVSPG